MMKINGKTLPSLEVFPSMMTVADCAVVRSNKLGAGHGEAKFYVGSKDIMHQFLGPPGFTAECFMLKEDLLFYMQAIKNEYLHPSQPYAKSESMPYLWNERLAFVQQQPDVIFFRMDDQPQIQGPRGYLNSQDAGYALLRQLALPLVSYVYVEKVGDAESPLFYWKLFVDFDTIWENQHTPLVFRYGKKSNDTDNIPVEVSGTPAASPSLRVRKGQSRYREQLLEQCRFCPFTMVSDDRLLIASHIKPWAVCSDDEKLDPYNGYMLTPLYDKLFDKGFITFTETRHVILSEFLSPLTWRQLKLKSNMYLPSLPMDDRRAAYLQFHQQSVFKGSFSSLLAE